MRDSIISKVSNLNKLEPHLQRICFYNGDIFSKRKVAGLASIIPEIEEKIIRDSDLVAYWAEGSKSREREKLIIAFNYATTQHAIVSFIKQENNTLSIYKKILKYAEKNSDKAVISFLLEVENLPLKFRERLIELYLIFHRGGSREIGYERNNFLRDKVKINELDRYNIIKYSTWDEFDIMQLGLSDLKVWKFRKLYISKMLELDNLTHLNNDEYFIKNVSKILLSLLDLSDLDTSDFTKLLGINFLTSFYPEIITRRDNNIYKEFKSLNCSFSNCKQSGKHSLILNRIDKDKMLLDFNRVKLAVEAVVHYNEIDVDLTRRIFSNLLGDGVRELIDLVLRSNNLKFISIVAENSGIYFFEDLKIRRYILKHFATNGLLFNSRDLSKKELKYVVTHLRPLHIFLKDRDILREVLDRIDTSDELKYEYIFNSLDTWEGNLGELIKSSNLLIK